MSAHRLLAVAALLVVCLMACGPTPAQVNNSGHEPYLSGDYAKALESYRDALERSPDSGEPHYNSGNALYRTEEYEDALQSYDQSLSHAWGELRARGFFNRGNAAFQQQNYPEAVEAYEEVLRMNPDNRDAKHNLELALSRMSPTPQQDEQQDQEEEQEEQDEENEEQQSQEQQQEQEREQESREHDQPMTETQARQVLESVGQAAQTLQERRGQALVSPKPPSEFDW